MATQAQIQSVVDGECSHDVRATLLRELDSNPSEWRTLALALLEEQQWAKQISSLAKSHSNQRFAMVAADSAARGESHLTPSQSSVPVMSSGLLGHSGEEPAKRVAPWFSALAASFLICIGFYGGTWLSGVGRWKSNGEHIEAVAKLEKEPQLMEDMLPLDGRLDSDMRMLVSGPNQKREEIPIYDLNKIDHDVFVAREMYEVARINRRLRKEGFELDVRPEFYTGKLNDGRQLIVPVKHVGLKPYGL